MDAQSLADELRLLQRTSAAVSQAPTVGEALQAVVDLACAEVGWAFGQAWLPDASCERLVLSEVWRAGGPGFEALRHASEGLSPAKGEGALGEAWVTGEPVLVQRFGDEASPVAGRAEAAGAPCGAVVPVMAGPDVVAVLEFFRTDWRPSDTRYLAVLTAVARHLGTLVEAKRAEAAWRRSEGLLRAAIVGSRVVLLLIGPDGTVTAVEPGALPALLLDEDLVGRSVDELELLVPGLAAAARDALDGCSVVREVGFEDHWYEVTAHPLAGEGPEACVALAIVDASERLLAARALDQAHRELRRHSEQLERSNAELSEFASVVSHDLSEPLRAIAGYVDLLRRRYEGQMDERADAYIHQAVEGCARMRTIIDDLLVYARSGTASERRTVDLGPIAVDVVTALQHQIEQAGASVALGNLPQVQGDASALRQVMQNLISNAVKFHRVGEPVRVRVFANRHDDAWVISVEDNGIGVEPEYRDRVFGLFKRLHASGAYPGTGIGLALCRKLVERWGGWIWIEGTPGGGATFHFTVPLEGGMP